MPLKPVLTHLLSTLLGALAGAAAFIVWTALPRKERVPPPVHRGRVLYLVDGRTYHYPGVCDDLP